MITPDLGLRHRFIAGAGEGASAPTLLLLHGTGGDEDSLLAMGAALLPGAARLSPRGQVLEAGMPRFFRRLAEGVFDLEDLHARTHELADFIAAAAFAYGFEAQKVVAVGYSNGANIAASLLLLRPQVLAGAVLLHPMVPLRPAMMPDLRGKPIFISAGQSDPLVAPAETERLADLLRGCGASVDISWQSGGHSIGAAEFEAARGWVAQQKF